MITVAHPLEPVWNTDSRILILGTMPSPASRNAGFYYMHPQNRFWCVLVAVFGEKLAFTNKGLRTEESYSKADKAVTDARKTLLKTGGMHQKTDKSPDLAAAIAERRDFLIHHHIALWDVLASCDINGAADSSIKNARPNDFTEIFEKSEIDQVFCTGKTAFSLWQKVCAPHYESQFYLSCECLPSTSPANAAWTLEKLVKSYSVLRKAVEEKNFTTPTLPPS